MNIQGTIIKTHVLWELIQYKELKYFKNGRANIHIKASYCIEFNNAKAWSWNKHHEDIDTGMFWIKTKKEALAAWTLFLKTQELGGVKLKKELFYLMRDYNEKRGA